MQQVVEAIVENERAHAIEELGDAAHDEVSVDGEEEVVHAAIGGGGTKQARMIALASS